MTKTLKIYVGVLFLLLVALSLSQKSATKEIDWRPTFNRHHKSPWGTFVLFKELLNLDKDIKIIDKTSYEKLRRSYDYDVSSNYIFINDELHIDNTSSDELLDYVGYGNNVYFITQHLPKYLKDTLGFSTVSNRLFPINLDPNSILQEEDDRQELALYFANTELNPKKYFFRNGVSQSYFKELDSLKTTVLGYNNFDGVEKINFIRIKYGDGYFYINLQPYAFTNYQLLKENHANYASSVLSYLKPDATILWDSHQKSNNNIDRSSISFILSKPALAWAWRLAILGLIVFVIFMAKRRQRIIAIIKPLENTTIAFAKTIGELYYEEGEPKDVLFKKINYFLAFIREKYLIDTENLDDNLITKIYLKSGAPEDDVRKLIYHIIYINKKRVNTENDIVVLNKLIENFHKKIKL